MSSKSDAATLAEERVDDLKVINGIGPTFSQALTRIGVRGFADLAKYTPEELSQTLLDQADRKIPSERIEAENWIGQARELASQATEGTETTDVETETVEQPDETLSTLSWRQQAGFSLFFDYVTDESGEQQWQTRVYHDESGEESVLAGVKTPSWVNWILERAGLTLAPEAIAIQETDVSISPTSDTAPPAKSARYEAQIEILGVQITQAELSSDQPERALMAEIDFRISGEEMEKLASDEVPFQIELHAVNLESGAVNFVESEQSRLQPQVFEYRSRQILPIPDLGRYELQSIVLLLPPAEMMACYQGPIVNVVP